MKRDDYLDWDQYFMGIARLSALRSKDPSTQVGACIVNDQKKIIGIGYNGLPTGIDDNLFPWGNKGDFLDTKYPYVCHAELNAILNSTMDIKGASLYVTLFPCNECTKAIIQSGIKTLYYISDKYKDLEMTIASKKMLDSVGIKYIKLDSVAAITLPDEY
ncbi:dCMP deaminase family protein [Mollicutes bacterium LVI A0039]|nr:dCMP deaminase family protein [Mollicutes bacterium LVI A0039]